MKPLPHRPFARLLASIALAAAAQANAAADPAALEQALGVFQRAAGGEQAAIEPAADQLAALLQADPADPLLRAYAGAATTLRARATLLPWKKLAHAEDGLALIDKALAQLDATHDGARFRGVPVSLEARFTAASTFLALPSMFNRQPRGAHLLDEVLNSPLFEASPVSFKAAVWHRAGIEAANRKRPDEAREWLRRAAASGAPSAGAAQAKLKEL
jgi:hypothetical protein